MTALASVAAVVAGAALLRGAAVEFLAKGSGEEPRSVAGRDGREEPGSWIGRGMDSGGGDGTREVKGCDPASAIVDDDGAPCRSPQPGRRRRRPASWRRRRHLRGDGEDSLPDGYCTVNRSSRGVGAHKGLPQSRCRDDPRLGCAPRDESGGCGTGPK